MKLISGTSNPQLAENIAANLKIDQVKCEIETFGNGEKKIWIKGDVYGQTVCLVQSFSDPVDSVIIETLLLADALERMGAENVILVIPWMGYSLQDKMFRNGEPISAKVVANIVSNSFIHRVMLMDLHNDSIQGFYSVPTNYLSAIKLFETYIEKEVDADKIMIGSPDFGGLKRARTLAKHLGLELVNIDKTRDMKTGQVRAIDLHGVVKNSTVVFFDDVIVSGGTIVEASELAKNEGANQVYFLATHGIFSGNAKQKLQKSQADKIVITNTINHEKLPSKIEVLDVSPVFAGTLSGWL